MGANMVRHMTEEMNSTWDSTDDYNHYNKALKLVTGCYQIWFWSCYQSFAFFSHDDACAVYRCCHGVHSYLCASLQSQCPLSLSRHWTHRVQWPKKSIFLEMKHHLLKFKETEVGWQPCCYLRRSWDTGWPNFCAICSFSLLCGVSRGTDRATVYM